MAKIKGWLLAARRTVVELMAPKSWPKSNPVQAPSGTIHPTAKPAMVRSICFWAADHSAHQHPPFAGMSPSERARTVMHPDYRNGTVGRRTIRTTFICFFFFQVLTNFCSTHFQCASLYSNSYYRSSDLRERASESEQTISERWSLLSCLIRAGVRLVV